MKDEKNITPHWRTLKTGGVINEKRTGGAEAQNGFYKGKATKWLKGGQK